jgi:hypothetical protein
MTPYVGPSVPSSAKPVEANQSWSEEVVSANLGTQHLVPHVQRLSPKC